jgi:uncharacterized protein YjbJ (UPF0337 family)
MNWDTIEGSWKEMVGRAQAKWGDITGDEWTKINGRREEMVGLVQKRYGKARDAAEKEVDDWFGTL